ncbi:smg6 nonsense mediated mRNA decay factor [Haematobia irritans]|uniref:smg6 nonsense mediated mRNA decay factor n=1 Tax=Haematobia irritans TaxID=7368 RepID=UPI003F4FB118
MNRKSREQNDISIIIGNLPRRIQDKIIIREGSNEQSAKLTGITRIGDTRGNAAEGNNGFLAGQRSGDEANFKGPPPVDGEVIAIDYFLRLPATLVEGEQKEIANRPASEASGTINNASTVKVQRKQDMDPEQIVSVPGLIRLNVENARKLSDVSSVASTNHDRRNRHQTRQDVLLSSKLIAPMSPARQIKKINHPTWFGLLNDEWGKRLHPKFESLQQLMDSNQIMENWEFVRSLRLELQNIFQHLLLANLKFCCEEKVDSFFWKILFYNIRENLKQQHHNTQAVNRIRMLIGDGIEFYDHLYQKLREKFLSKRSSACIDQNEGSTSQRAQRKIEFIAKVMAQKLLISLGDLWRYKIKDCQGQDYTEAEKYYQMAQVLVPANGVPYNQLAIISILNRKKFDAIYFHMRSLMSSNAIYSSKESLLVLFDEIRKKYEETELKSSPIHSNNSQSKSMRKEVWICPNGMRLYRTDSNGNSNYKFTISEEKRYKEMPIDELLRRITSLYLFIIGKLFNGIGMETIVEHQRKFFMQLNVLLNHEKLAFTRTKILKILTLNIFVIEHNLNKDTRRYHAFNFCNQFYGLMLRRTNTLLVNLPENPEDFDNEKFLELTTVLQYSRIYSLWLRHHVNIWEPVKNEEHIYINCWLELEKLFQLLKQDNLTQVYYIDVKFEEDTFLAGFTPASSFVPKARDERISDESLQLKARLKGLKEFESFYTQHCKLLKNIETSHFVNEVLNSDIKQAFDDLQIDTKIQINGIDDNENSEICISEEDDYDADNNDENLVVNGDAFQFKKSNKSSTKLENDQLSQLSKLKKELEAKSNVKKMYCNKLEEILKYVDTKLYIEVRPKYLLPDTNCFIDCLEDFERIVNDFKRYTLIIPLTVVKELDGLSKGVKVESSSQESMQKHRIHHYDDVSTRAKKSLDFIKSAKSHVKCATTKGSIINASLFGLVEEEHVSNDDKILATALAMSKTMSSETSKDGKCFIQTELLLITTDRNLRVKALSRNLTVSELPEFIQWAKDCN